MSWICGKFPHINDDARSKSHQMYVVFCCSLLSFQCKSITATKYMLCCTAVYCPFSLSQFQLRNPHHFSGQPSLQVSQTLRSSYLSHMTATTQHADQSWHLHCTDSRNTMIYAHTTLRILPACDINLGSLTLLAPEAGDFLELILLHLQNTNRVTAHLLNKQTWLDGYSEKMYWMSRSLSIEWVG